MIRNKELLILALATATIFNTNTVPFRRMLYGTSPVASAKEAEAPIKKQTTIKKTPFSQKVGRVTIAGTILYLGYYFKAELYATLKCITDGDAKQLLQAIPWRTVGANDQGIKEWGIQQEKTIEHWKKNRKHAQELGSELYKLYKRLTSEEPKVKDLTPLSKKSKNNQDEPDFGGQSSPKINTSPCSSEIANNTNQ